MEIQNENEDVFHGFGYFGTLTSFENVVKRVGANARDGTNEWHGLSSNGNIFYSKQ